VLAGCEATPLEQVSARAVPVAARAAGGRRASGVPRLRYEQGGERLSVLRSRDALELGRTSGVGHGPPGHDVGIRRLRA